MSAPECSREQDVINAIVTGRWPDRCDEALRAHAVDCKVCRELVEVASVLRLDRDAMHEGMNLPSAGQVWWRAAIRARLEASQRVARPFSWLFGASLACAAGLAIALIQLLWSPVQTAWGLVLPTLKDLAPLTAFGGGVLLGAAACLLLAPLALYFVLSDD